MMPRRYSDERLQLARARDKARRVRDAERRNARRDKADSRRRFTVRGN